MLQKKTLHQREKELQTWLATPSGREDLQKLAFKYFTASGESRRVGKSAITYILVYEREQGIISHEIADNYCSTAKT
jgi:hypothetical protein